jgi:hypothetical protein
MFRGGFWRGRRGIIQNSKLEIQNVKSTETVVSNNPEWLHSTF